MIRFQLGRVVATPGALSALEKAEQLPAAFLDRHVNGDLGMCLTQTSKRMRDQSSRGFAFCRRIPPAPVIAFGC